MKKFLVFLIVIFAFFPLFRANAQSQQKKNVLVLNSYHKGYAWSDNVMEGVRSVFDKENVDIHVEYMDTKRMQDDRHFKNLFELYLHKFAGNEFEVIITSDDNAFKFILEYRSVLFPGVPVVFCGLNNFKDSMVVGRKSITGVIEDFDIKSTLDIALKLHPQTKNIFVLGERGRSGRNNTARVKKLMPDYKVSFHFIFPADFTKQEMREKLRKLPGDSIVLFFNFFRFKSGEFFSLKDQMLFVGKNSKVPVYTCWSYRIKYGVLGGMAVNGNFHGKAAAEMALRILKGEKTENIPIMRKSPNKYMFDYKQMKRFRISRSDLPEGSIILNEPSPFYRIQRSTLVLIAFFIIFLGAVIFVLAVNIQERKRVAEELIKKENELSALLDNISDIAWFKDRESKYIIANEAFCKSCGFSKEELKGKTDYDFWPKENAERYRSDDRRVVEQKKTIKVEEPFVDKDGRETTIETLKSPIFDSKGEIIGTVGISRDMTERRKAEDELKASLEEKRVLLQEVHHRVKNNMQVISSMLMLQSSFIKNKEFIDILQPCQDRIMSMALVHEKIYESKELANINFREYLETLSESLYSHYAEGREGITMKLDVEDMFLDIDTSVPLGLIINELLTNALKHAFKEREKGELSLALHCVDGDNLGLTVKDDGVGLPEDFDMENPQTFGLQIVSLLAKKQLHGKIDIRRNGGTEIQILVEKVKDKKRP